MEQVTPDAESSALPILPRGACVLHVDRSAMGNVKFVTGYGLSEHAIDLLREYATSRRDEGIRVHHMRAVAREIGLPGLAILTTGHDGFRRQYVDVPEPLAFPFEPIHLDGSRTTAARLQHLTSGPAIQDDLDAPSPNPVRWAAPGLGLSWSFFFVWLFMLSVCIIDPLRKRGSIRLFEAIMFLMVTAWLVGTIAVYWWRPRAWFLLPGGVITRQALARNLGVKLDRFAPGETILTISPEGLVASNVVRQAGAGLPDAEQRGMSRPPRRVAEPAACAAVGTTRGFEVADEICNENV